MKCGEKWGKQHKCPNQIPLHILEEFLKAVQSPDESPDDNDLGSSDEELLTLSFAAIQKLPYLVQEAPLVHVTTANGDKLSSSIIVPEVGIHKGIHSPPQQEYWTLLTMI